MPEAPDSALCGLCGRPLCSDYSLIAHLISLTLSHSSSSPLFHMSHYTNSAHLIFIFTASSSLPGYGLIGGAIKRAQACFLLHRNFCRTQGEKIEAATVIYPIVAPLHLPLASRAKRSQGKQSCCFGPPLGASCRDSAPNRDISERSCWSGPGREELGVWDIFQWRTTLSGLMLVCIHNLGPGGVGAIQKSNRKNSLMKLRMTAVSLSSQRNELVFARSHPGSKHTFR